MVDDYKYLLLTHGIPGAGKSTFIAKCFGKRTDTKIICPDDIREEFAYKKDDWKDAFEYLIWKIANKRITESLQTNRITIVDATFICRKDILKQYKQMNRINPNIKFLIIDFSKKSLEDCLKNNRKRYENGGRFVPEDVIKNMYQRIKRTKLLEFEPMTISYKEMK